MNTDRADFATRLASLSPEKRALLDKRLRGDADAASVGVEPIAIVGMACRFPGADGLEAFWSLVRDGRDAIGEVPPDRWDSAALYDPDPERAGHVSTRWGGFLTDVDRFDAAFFGISPREATQMDPQQRLLLEISWHAFEHAGATRESLQGSRTGVFVGAHNHSSDYLLLQFADLDALDAFSGTGSAHNLFAGRVSYFFDLVGPSLVVDTACSSSLVAVHLACQSLRARECNAALAAGVNLMIAPHFTIAASRMHMLSPRGRCSAFDAAADGFVRAEGCGAVVLKRLDDAKTDGDRVIAVIRGSAVNQDGRTNGITAPNGRSQRALIEDALRAAGTSASRVTYVEAHGTGTSLGDPIEVEALAAVIGANAPGADACALGAVKANVGHLEGAAGVAGLIKTALCLEHREIPPVAGFVRLNPHITLAHSRLQIPVSAKPWHVSHGPRVAGVSSFGWSGTNIHVIVQQAAIDTVAPAVRNDAVDLLPISAASPDALARLAERTAAWLEGSEAFAWSDAVFSACRRRSHLPHRLAVLAASRADCAAALRAHSSGAPSPSVVTGTAGGEDLGIVFVFSGQGSQWVGMARSLLEIDRVFRDAIDACDRVLAAQTGWSVIDELRTDPKRSRLDEIDVIQPTIFAIQVALANVWRSHGIEPDVVVGHSMGEVAAAHIAGALTLEDAVRVICARSRLLKRLSGGGAMAVVELSIEDTRAVLHGREDALSIAVSNSRRSTVVSGDPAALGSLMKELSARDVFCRSIKVDVASHSPQVDALREDLLREIGTLTPRATAISLHSTVLDGPADGADLDALYWVRNLRDTVRFGSVIERLVRCGARAFIEISPHPILLPAIETTLAEAGVDGRVVASWRRDEDERHVFRKSIAQLYAFGIDPDWRQLAGHGRFVPGPAYPFSRERYWLDANAPSRAPWPRRDAGEHSILGPAQEVAGRDRIIIWRPDLDPRRNPIVTQHVVSGEPILAAAVMVDLFWAAARHALGGRVRLTDITFERPFVVGGLESQLLAECGTSSGCRLTLFARNGDEPWTPYARAQADADTDATNHALAADTMSGVVGALGGADLYERFSAAGVEIGPSLRVLSRIEYDARGIRGWLNVPDAVRRDARRLVIHPAMLDGALQAAVIDLVAGESTPELRVVRGITSVRLIDVAPMDADVETVFQEHASDGVRNVRLAIPGIGVVAIDGIQLATAGSLSRRAALGEGVCHAVQWTPSTRPASIEGGAKARQGSWMVVARDPHRALPLARRFASKGDAVEVIRDARHFRDVLDRLVASHANVRGVIYLTDASIEMSPPGGADNAMRAAETSRRHLSEMVEMVRTLGTHEWSDWPRMWIVTHNVPLVPESPIDGVWQAALWGFARVLAEEHRELWGGAIDLGVDPGSEPAAAVLVDEVRRPDGEDQIAHRAGRRLVPRLAPWSAPPDIPGPRIVPDGAYIVTGGLGDIGRVIASWLADLGARHLVLVSRRGIEPAQDSISHDAERARTVAALSARGCRVDVEVLDVGERSALAALVDRLRSGGCTIRGVVHCAAVVDDRLIGDLDEASLDRVMRPKAMGAWWLHDLLADQPLDFFVMFSSVGALLGQAGQAGYAASNAVLDALAHARRAAGRPALSVNWGAWRGLGFARGDGGQRTVRALDARGMRSLETNEGCEILARLIGADATQIAVMPIDWRTFAETSLADHPLVADLCRSRISGATVRGASAEMIVAQLAAAAPERRRDLLEAHVQRHLAAVLKVPFEKIDPLRPLGSLGLESLLALELRGRLERTTGLQLSATMVWNHPTVRALSVYLAKRLDVTLGSDGAIPEAPAAASTSAVTTTLADVTDEQALRALQEGR